MEIAIQSEYGRLRRVLVHRPGPEVARLTERNRARLLFEGVPCLDALGREHDGFVETLRRESGTEVLYLERLLAEALRDERTWPELVVRATRIDGCRPIADALLATIGGPADLVRVLVEGLTHAEARARGIHVRDGRREAGRFLLSPLPNLYFMRDPAFVVGGDVVNARMRFRARAREADLVAFALARRARSEHASPDAGRDLEIDGTDAAVEGGDVIVLGPEAIAVGLGERTNGQAIRSLAAKLFAAGRVRRVYEVPLPKRREYMHLDTVFTLAGPGVCVAHAEAVRDSGTTRVHTPAGSVDTGLAFLDVIRREIEGCDVVETGDGDAAHAASEQRTDGANLFAIAPGKVVAYESNTRTNRALRRAGVEVVEIAGGELVKGLGGPRCMTLPLEREVAA